ncbi:MAG: Gfo/Idh/MocA family oxidoreductase [Myxococcota bacterium]|nr:Gfo/Idh/MocA family oxidoreductase [Myxococcota bacterium]
MIQVAVVGAGHWGPNLINNFERSSRSEVRYVVDRDAKRLAAVAERFPSVETCADFDRAVDDAGVDAVVIATPTSTHFDLARRALEAGKHVLVEKPLTDSVESSRALCELAEARGLTLMVGHVFVYNAAARRVRQFIEDDELGRIYYISMVRTNLGPIRTDVNAAWDLAAHDISLASYWLDAWPTQVSATGGQFINPGIDDVVFATLRFPGGILANLHASWLNPRKSRDITVVGEKKMLTFDDVNLDAPLRLHDKQVEDSESGGAALVDSFHSFRTSVHLGEVFEPRVEPSEPLRNECEHFLDCLTESAIPVSPGRSGLAVVQVLGAISTSLAEGGREVEVEIG